MSDPVDVSAIMNSEEAPQIESAAEVVVEEAPVVEEPAPAPVEEPAPAPAVEGPAPAPAVEAPAPAAPVEAPSTQEVVQNVQEMLSSTDTSGSVNELENRVKVLEERLEKLINYLKCNRAVMLVKINEL